MQVLEKFEYGNLEKYDFVVLGRRGGFAIANDTKTLTIVTPDKTVAIDRVEVREIEWKKQSPGFHYGGGAMTDFAINLRERRDAREATGIGIRLASLSTPLLFIPLEASRIPVAYEALNQYLERGGVSERVHIVDHSRAGQARPAWKTFLTVLGVIFLCVTALSVFVGVTGRFNFQGGVPPGVWIGLVAGILGLPSIYFGLR